MKVILIDSDRVRSESLLFEIKSRFSYKTKYFADPKVGLDYEDWESVDLLITEIAERRRNYWKTIRHAKRINPQLKILALTGIALGFGLSRKQLYLLNGFVNNWESLDYFLEKVKLIMEKSVNEIEADFQLRIAEIINSKGHRGELSTVQVEVLNLIAQNFTASEIAFDLNISTGTVNTHIQRIYKKLGVNSKIEAVDFAYELGIIAPPT